jgi:hypothetical protein
MRKPFAVGLAITLATLTLACGTSPGGAPTVAPSFPALNASDFSSGEAFNALPEGNMLATVDVGTLLNQTIPATLQNSPEQKAKFDAELKTWQEQYGIDPNQIKLMAISGNITSSADTGDVAAIMTGSFDTEKLKAALRKDPKTGAEARTEDYNGTTIYIRQAADKEQAGAVAGQAGATAASKEVAIAVMDASSVVAGTPAGVRKAIDARASKGANATSNATLFNTFKETKQTGLVRFALAPPPTQPAPNADPTTQALANARYVFGALDATSGLAFDVTMRADNADSAKPIYDQLSQGIEQVKPMVANNPQLQGVKTILDSTTVAQADKDVKVAITLTPIQLLMLYQQFQTMSGGAAPAGAAGAPPSTMPPATTNTNAP